jgi:uncharacterized protein YjbJ (UPF0337 family)
MNAGNRRAWLANGALTGFPESWRCAGRRAPDASSPLKEPTMNNDRIEGNWKQLTGKIKAQWGDLTDDDLQQAQGNSEYLVGRIQERYGIAKDEAQRQVDDFQSDL